jgi:hypothetical protein
VLPAQALAVRRGSGPRLSKRQAAKLRTTTRCEQQQVSQLNACYVRATQAGVRTLTLSACSRWVPDAADTRDWQLWILETLLIDHTVPCCMATMLTSGWQQA